MKRVLIFAISVLFSVNLTAQIGIDLTEMVNAPDSGYIIITTGDEYPERGLQKYVAFDSLIPLDTIFRKADSVCFQFAYQTAPVCFPDSAIQNLAYVRDGDTIRISISGGNTISFRDSTRSNADIAQVARDSLGTLDTAYRVVDEMGEGSDSIRFEMTDGRHWAVVDSVVRQDFEKVGDTIYLTKTDTGAYMVDSRIIKVFHKGDSIVVEGNRGERWAVIDKIGGQLDDVYFEDGELCIKYTDAGIPTTICTPVDIPGDDWGNQVVEIAGDNISGDGTAGNKLTVNKQDLQSVTDKGNVTTNPVKFLNRPTGNRANSYEMAHYSNDLNNDDGTIVIRFPNTPNSMFKMEVSVFSYNDESVGLNYSLNGYTHTSSTSWAGGNIGAGVTGYSSAKSNTRVRFANDANGDRCVLIGDLTSEWNYPLVSISKLEISSFSQIDNIEIDIVTDEAEFTNIIEPQLNRNISVDMLDGEHGDYYIQEIFKLGDTIRLSETGYYVLDKYRNAIGGRNLIDDSHGYGGTTPNRFIRTSYATLQELTDGVATYEVDNPSAAARFEYNYSDLDTGMTYVYSIMTSLPEITQVESHPNSIENDRGTLKVSDSAYVHYIVFNPTDPSGSGTIRQYYGAQPLGSTFRFYYAQLQEGDFPTMWHPAQNDLIGVITPDMIDTIIHIGDSIQVELNSGDTFTVRDSFLTAAEVTQIARDSLPHIDTFHRSGDSLYLTLTDGTILPVRDSFVDLAGVRDSIQMNIDSIAAHRIDINEIGDTLDVHRTDINQNITDITILNDSIDQHRIDIDAISEVDTMYRFGDSIRLELTDGRTFTVRDSFRTDAEISDLVDEGQVNIYNSDGVIDDGTRTVEFGHILKFQSSSSIGQVQYIVQDGSGDNYVMTGTIGAIQEAYVDGDINFQRASQGGVYAVSIQNTSTGNYSGYALYPDKMLLIPSQDISSLDSTSNYYLKLMESDGTVKYRPVIQPDTITRSGDSIYLHLDDGSTLAVRDSFLTPEDVMDVIGDSLEIVRLDTVIHTGDSIRLEMSDGQMFTVVDSFLSAADVAKIARDSIVIPEIDLSGIRDSIQNNIDSIADHRTDIDANNILITNHIAIDADVDSTNEIQQLTKSNDTIYLSDGGYVLDSDTPYDDQEIRDSLANHRTDIDQNATDITNHIAADNDLDPTNELQEISRTGTNVTLSDGGGTVSIEDDDPDPTNEIQGFGNYSNPSGESGLVKLENNSSGVGLKLSGTGGVDVDASFDGNDVVMTIDASSIDGNTNLSHTKVGDNVTINSSTGSGTTFSVADGDSDNTNELQDLTRTGDIIGLSNSVATTLDRNVTAITHTGDSVKFTTSDGREFVVRDSVLSKDTVLSWVDDTSIYTHDGVVLDPVRTVEIPDTAKLQFDLKAGGQFELKAETTANSEGDVTYRTGTLGALYPRFNINSRAPSSGDTTQFTAMPQLIQMKGWDGPNNSHTILLSPNLQGINIETTNRDVNLDAKRYFIHSESQGGGTIAFDTIRLQDVGISPEDTARWAEGGATQTISRTGTDVTLSDGGGTVSIADGDSDPTNEIDIMQAYTGSNLVRLVPSYNEFQITGSGGISISSSTSSGSTDRFTWNIDGSGISSSPWAGSYPNPYVSAGAANVAIGSTPNTSRLFINNTQPTDQSLDIDHYVGDNSTMVQVTNTRRGGSWYLFGGTDGVSMRMFNTAGSQTFRLYGNGNILTTGSIATDGDIGTSSKVLYGGSNPRWDDLPTQDAYTLVKTTEPALSFRRNGTPISNIAFVGTGGIQVNDGFGQIEIDGSGISGGATNLGSSKSGTNVTVTSSTGTNTTFSVADNDNSPTNEIQSLGLSGTTLTISGGGGSQSLASIASKWTADGSNIYRNSGVGIGIAPLSNTIRFNYKTEINNGNELHFNYSGSKGRIYGSSSGLNIAASSGEDLRLTAGNVVMKIGSDFASNTIVTKSANFTLPSASGYPNGTVKKVINTGGSNITITVPGLGGFSTPVQTGISVVSNGSSWYLTN